MHDPAPLTIGIAALAGCGAMIVAARLRFPAIVLLLATGALVGRGGLGWVRPDALGAGMRVFVEFAVAVILFEGALSLRLSQFRANPGPIRNLLTVGALVTFLGASVMAHLALGFSWRHAAVTGAVLIVTGPTVVTPLLRHVRPRRHLAEILRWEGILIDPIGAVAAIMVLRIAVATEDGAVLAGVVDYFVSAAVGSAVGAAGGFALAWLLGRQGFIREDLRNPLVLAFAFLSFAGAEALESDSGLFAVTVGGLTLASRQPPGLEEIERFKGELTSFVLGVIFVLLAAAVDLAAIVRLGARGPTFLAGLVVVRAACVLASTARSGLTADERVFLAWVSPRGVVACAVASLFTEILAQHGDPLAGEIRGAIFFVVVGTVTVQGLTARPLGRALGVLEADPNEVVIVGAERFGRALAAALAGAGVPVTLVDKNPGKLAGLPGTPALRSLAADAHDEDETASIEAESVAIVLAGTPNDGANALICAAFAARVGAGRVTQLPTSARSLERGARSVATRWPFAFGERLTRDVLEGTLAAGGRLRCLEVQVAETAQEARARLGTDLRPLVEIAATGVPSVIRERNTRLKPGTRVIGIESAPGAPAAEIEEAAPVEHKPVEADGAFR